MAHVQTQEEWEQEMCEKILVFIQNEIYLDLRFLSIALSALRPKPDQALHTFATDGSYLYYSKEQLLRVFQKNAGFLDRAYLHVILHCIFFHLWIRGNRDQGIWNLACDIVVEYTIDGMDKPCTKRILSWQRQKIYEELRAGNKSISAAVIYRMLSMKDMDELIGLQKEFFTDDHCHWPKEEKGRTGNSVAKNQWDKIARQTSMEQQTRGKDPKEGEEIFTAQLSAERGRRNYRDFLQKFSILKEEMHCDPDEFDLSYYTYGLMVYHNMPLIEPLESREVKKIQEFVIVVDTSYSTSGELVKNFLQETFHVLSQKDSFFHRCQIRIIQCDEKVQMDQEVRSEEEMQQLLTHFTVIGGGGTDFRPAFTYVNELLEQGVFHNLSGLLYFTDGKGIYPRKRPEYKTAFLFLDEYEEAMVPSWAIRLRLEPEDFLRGQEKIQYGKQLQPEIAGGEE